MSYQISIIDPVETEPITLSEAKAFMRIDADYDLDDTLIGILISSAREAIEKEINSALAPVGLMISAWNGSCLTLPYQPNPELVEVKKGDGILTDENYTFDRYAGIISINSVAGSPSFFYETNGAVHLNSWGAVAEDNSYSVYYTTGYTTIPAALKHALLIQVDYSYKNQGVEGMGVVSPQALILANKYNRNLAL